MVHSFGPINGTMMGMAYQVEVHNRAAKNIAKLPRKTRDRVLAKIEALGDDPLPQGVTKLTGEDGFRLRVGDYRIVYTVEHQKLTVWVIRVMHRSQVYTKKGNRR